jgi:hypothetical protein
LHFLRPWFAKVQEAKETPCIKVIDLPDIPEGARFPRTFFVAQCGRRGGAAAFALRRVPVPVVLILLFCEWQNLYRGAQFILWIALEFAGLRKYS